MQSLSSQQSRHVDQLAVAKFGMNGLVLIPPLPVIEKLSQPT